MVTPLIFIATLITNESLLQKACTLNNTGIVCQQDSYIYLNIKDDYIHELYNYLPTSRILSKPDYFSSTKSAGAHITIAYREENILLSPEDLGKTHTFVVENLSHVTLGDKEYFVLIASCPSLEQLRRKYGLSEKPCYKGIPIDFHITIALHPVQSRSA